MPAAVPVVAASPVPSPPATTTATASLHAQVSLLCLPEEEADVGYFDGEKTLFADDYSLGRKLGDGGYSEVYQCAHRAHGTPAAVKIIAKSRLDDASLRALKEEVRVMKRVSDSGRTLRCVTTMSPPAVAPRHDLDDNHSNHAVGTCDVTSRATITAAAYTLEHTLADCTRAATTHAFVAVCVCVCV